MEKKFKIVSDSSGDIHSLGDFPFASAPLKIIAGEREWIDDSNLIKAGHVKPRREFIVHIVANHDIYPRFTAFINDVIYGSFSRKAIELKRLAWRSLHIWKNRKVAEVTLTRDDFRSVRGSKADAEDIIEIPRSVAKNEVALFFYQIPDRTRETRCSIRTRGDWDATALAGRFGGGGHRKAAGCTIDGSIASAKRKIRAAVKEMFRQRNSKTVRIEV